MENTPTGPETEAAKNIVKQIIPGASPELVREVVEDELSGSIPKPASEEVELERGRRAEAGD